MYAIVTVSIYDDDIDITINELPSRDRIEAIVIMNNEMKEKLTNLRRHSSPYKYGLVVNSDDSVSLHNHILKKDILIKKVLELKGEIL